MANHHRHQHHKDDEPKTRLRNLAAPIILLVIFGYGVLYEFPLAPRTDPKKLAVGIAIFAAAAFLWVLSPRKDRQ